MDQRLLDDLLEWLSIPSISTGGGDPADLDVRELDVLAGTHGAGQIADRTAQEPCADVEAEHERCVRHRLEEDSSVPRAALLRLRLADEA